MGLFEILQLLEMLLVGPLYFLVGMSSSEFRSRQILDYLRCIQMYMIFKMEVFRELSFGDGKFLEWGHV